MPPKAFQHRRSVGERPDLKLMSYRLSYGTVPDHPRKVIHVVRILGALLEPEEIDEVAETMRQRLLAKSGEQTPDVVVVQGGSRETLRLFGHSYSVGRVRTALFHAAIRWAPLRLEPNL
jgi:hypothetical protein